MKAPLFVRTLSPDEQAKLFDGLRSCDAFTLRRCQILLASSRGQRPSSIARNLGCATQEAQTDKAGVRIIPCWLPTKSPWLNRIEPKWVHGKRAIAEPARLLTASELRH